MRIDKIHDNSQEFIRINLWEFMRIYEDSQGLESQGFVRISNDLWGFVRICENLWEIFEDEDAWDLQGFS